MKKILNATQTRELALETILELASIVKTTLGPAGNPIILEQLGQNPDGTSKTPLITKDGVSVAEQVQYRNPAKNVVAQTVIEVAKNTVNSAGDGTTTAIVLAEALYLAGYKHLKHGQNGIQLYNDLKRIKDEVVLELKEMTNPVKGREDVVNVAKISANGDEEIAELVYQALSSVGEDGHIHIEEAYSRDTSLKIMEGAMYKQGWRTFGPHGSLLVNNKGLNICEMDKPSVVLHAGKLSDTSDIFELTKKLYGIDESGAYKDVFPLLIIAYDYSDEVKNVIVQMRVQAKIPIAALKAPFDGSPNARTQMLEDLAVLLGGKVTARGIIELKDIKPEHVGAAERIEIGPDEVVFYEGQGLESEILDRVQELKQLLDVTQEEFDRGNIKLRIGKLINGVAIIKVGGDTEAEMKEKRDRVEDALCAARVAISEGVLPGGGAALYRISKRLKGEGTAYDIMREALKAPIKQLIENAGENSEVILALMPEGLGYDVKQHVYVDLVTSGILDPLKVTRSALENAVSIVGLLLTTGGSIIRDLDSKDGMPNPLAGLLG